MKPEEVQPSLTKEPIGDKEARANARSLTNALGVAWGFIVLEMILAVLGSYLFLEKVHPAFLQDLTNKLIL